ncbi:AAA family ATPase [Alicyclobacillus sp. ALC3]|uniref:AAA family ATPase n=1 Tax=Alicyclobacillus sp. ALC3 TaxID=2796143 RepID=UPI00237A00C1|nr:AAA family ATPase [Alicyclobacillus sp. ALC3]WDL97833.1 AAA family ATPase [Alicyclobacillus sp. ALC3]
MNITLTRLTLRNFKGVRDLTSDFGTTTDVFGDNATGKTTLFDAFLWLLFDKDSSNRKDFDIKTLDANGNPLPGLDHEVEATLEIDGRPLTLRKVYAEKWVKKRGFAISEFTGHETNYFIDGVPAKLKEFKDRVAAIVDEPIFKLLTSPSYFNEQLSWQERRRILLEVCGDVSDADVISSNDALAKLPDILAGRSIEDHRKIIAARRKEINDELQKIPVRIDEVERSKPDTSGLIEADLQTKIDQLRFEVDSKESELNRIQTGGEIAEQEKRQREIEGGLIAIKNQAGAGASVAIAQQHGTVQQWKEKAADLNYQARNMERQIKDNETALATREREAAKLRGEWATVNAEQFTDSTDDICPACGQVLPEEQVQSSRDKALGHFNQHKSDRLEQIVAQGKTSASEAARLKAENERLGQEHRAILQELFDAQTEQQAAEHKLRSMQEQATDPTDDPAYAAKHAELEAVKASILQLRSSNLDAVQRVRRELMDLRDELRATESKLASFDQVAKLDERIAQLSAEERRLAAEYETLEEQLYLTEEFIRTKVQMLEDRINGKFRFARFKLFEAQINGGVSETCQTTYNGVPYGSGLNNAARINVGLDIINTLSEHYGITAVIFIDNRESVTKLIDVDAQVVNLVVSEKDKTLRIETKHEPKEAA